MQHMLMLAYIYLNMKYQPRQNIEYWDFIRSYHSKYIDFLFGLCIAANITWINFNLFMLNW